VLPSLPLDMCTFPLRFQHEMKCYPHPRTRTRRPLPPPTSLHSEYIRQSSTYVHILAAFFHCHNAFYSPFIGFLPFHSLLCNSTAAQNHAHHIFRYVRWPTCPQRVKLTLSYRFDKASGVLPRLGAWTPPPAMPSASFVVG